MTNRGEILEATSKLRAIADDLEAALNPSLTDVKADFNVTENRLDWRAKHRTGTPSKITTDPELEEFILSRIEQMTFVEVACAVAENFPEDRHVSKSSVHRWWQKHGKQRLANRQILTVPS